MRIITGEARGKRLAALPGLSTRPTSDRVKESIFNIIQFDIEGRAALDLFSGSGQLGLEALSRGARFCDFVESDRRAAAVTAANIAACGFEARGRLHEGDALAFLARQKAGSFGLIFLDPPYQSGLLERAIERIFEFDILQQGGIMICEGSRGTPLPPGREPYRKLREYPYGHTCITTYTRLAEGGAGQP